MALEKRRSKTILVRVQRRASPMCSFRMRPKKHHRCCKNFTLNLLKPSLRFPKEFTRIFPVTSPARKFSVNKCVTRTLLQQVMKTKSDSLFDKFEMHYDQVHRTEIYLQKVHNEPKGLKTPDLEESQ